MYTVFINDNSIILTDSSQNEKDFQVYDYENVVLDEVIGKVKNNNIDGIVLFCKNLSYCWKKFQSHFKIMKAAGGLVLNQKKEFLFIYRDNKWDLPKGKIEERESIETTAIREVEEECGIEQLRLNRFLLTTYHLFFQNKQNILKETHWFLMSTNYKGKLTPQVEERITITEFKNEIDTQKALKNTHANIRLVFETYNV